MATILIVDDDPHTRQLYESLLTPFGHQVLQAADGRDGLQLAQEQKPDLIISDILMPTMNGYEFVTNLRKQPGLQNTAVVFQSASFLDHESRALGMHCGVREFISKPCDAESILKTVNRVLGLPSSLPAPVPLADGSKDAVPLLIDAFYEKGKQLDALSLRLAALLELGVDLAGSTDPRELLKKAANAARKIIGANYAGAGTLENGGSRLRYFVTSGIDEASAAKLGKLGVTGAFREIAVEGKTVGAFSRVGEPSRLALPVDHPPVGGFLGMPIQTSTRSYGLIYIADKLSGVEFTTENQRFLATIAAKLAVAYENTLRYQEIQERTAKLEHEIEQRKGAEDRFRLLIENAPTGIVICNGQGRITEATPGCPTPGSGGPTRRRHRPRL
jgi:CheY-like chemotaxis protein/PAS domain-containing protein